MLRPNALRPRIDHIDVRAMRRVALNPCRDCGSHDDHCIHIPTATVRCRCGRVSSVRAAPKSARPRAVTPRPAVRHVLAISTPRPREGGARVVVAAGRDGNGERDDGGGDDGDGGGCLGQDQITRALAVPPPGRAADAGGAS